MIINNKQISKLNVYAQSSFAERMGEFIRENYFDLFQANDPEKLKSIIDFKIEEAKSFNLEYENDVEDYIDILLDNNCFFTDLTKEQAIIDILNWPDRLPQKKLEILREYIMFDRK